MKKDQAFDSIVKNASPFIVLSHVLDDAGDILFEFHMHPQMHEHTLRLEEVSTGVHEAILTPHDMRELAAKLVEFAEVAETVVNEYEKQS